MVSKRGRFILGWMQGSHWLRHINTWHSSPYVFLKRYDLSRSLCVHIVWQSYSLVNLLDLKEDIHRIVISDTQILLSIFFVWGCLGCLLKNWTRNVIGWFLGRLRKTLSNCGKWMDRKVLRQKLRFNPHHAVVVLALFCCGMHVRACRGLRKLVWGVCR